MVSGVAPTKPERFKSGKLEKLWHLRVVAKGVQQPRDGNVDPEVLSTPTLSIFDLANEQLSSRLDVVGHHIHAAHDPQTSFRYELSELRRKLGIPLQKRLEIRDLV